MIYINENAHIFKELYKSISQIRKIYQSALLITLTVMLGVVGFVYSNDVLEFIEYEELREFLAKYFNSNPEDFLSEIVVTSIASSTLLIFWIWLFLIAIHIYVRNGTEKANKWGGYLESAKNKLVLTIASLAAFVIGHITKEMLSPSYHTGWNSIFFTAVLIILFAFFFKDCKIFAVKIKKGDYLDKSPKAFFWNTSILCGPGNDLHIHNKHSIIPQQDPLNHRYTQ